MAHSHFETDWGAIPIRSASSVCVHPRSFRSLRSVLQKSSSLYTFLFPLSVCCLYTFNHKIPKIAITAQLNKKILSQNAAKGFFYLNYSHSFSGFFFGLFMSYMLSQTAILNPFFYPLFHLSNFLLQKKLQNRLRNSIRWLRGNRLL